MILTGFSVAQNGSQKRNWNKMDDYDFCIIKSYNRWVIVFITQFGVAIATNCRAVTSGMYVNIVDHEREGSLFILLYRIYYVSISNIFMWIPMWSVVHYKTKLRGFSLQANYTDRATAACRRS
jgi:hypothetical protein